MTSPRHISRFDADFVSLHCLRPRGRDPFRTAGVSHEGRRNVAQNAADQVLQLLHGERPPHLINPEVRNVFLERRAAAPRALQAA